jgi:hypothetical protein
MSSKKKPKTHDVAVRIGAKVGLLMGGRLLPVLVVEDRGDLGPGGARVVRVEWKSKEADSDAQPDQFEVLAESLVGLPA